MSLTQFISIADNMLTFLLLLVLLYRISAFSDGYVFKFLSPVIWTLAYGLFHQPLGDLLRAAGKYLFLDHPYYSYFVITFLAALLFLKFCAGEVHFSQIYSITVYLCMVSNIKVLITSVSPVRSLFVESDILISIRNYILYFLCIGFCVWFLIRFSLPSDLKLPLHSEILLFLVPLCNRMIIEMIISVFLDTDLKFRYSATAFAAACLTLLVCYLFFSLTEALRKENALAAVSQNLRMQAEQANRMAGLIQSVRREKHELKNAWFYIDALCKEKRYGELEHYLDTEVKYRVSALEEFHTGNRLIDLLLTQKASEAKDLKIPVITNVLLPAELPFREDDICALLFNLLDNAIDASKKEPRPEIRIQLNLVKGYFHVRIENFSSRNVLEENAALTTTKDDAEHHGIGLQVVESIVKRYNGIRQFQMKGNFFTADVYLAMPQ